jgi:signal transduction histidine kinase
MPESTVRVLMARPSKALLPSLAIAELVFTVVEIAAVGGPLKVFFPGAIRDRALVAVLGLAVIWSAVMLLWLRPVLAGAQPHRFEAVYRLAQRIPDRGLWLREGLWAALGIGGALYLRFGRGVIASWQIATVITICLVHSLGGSLLRWALHKRMMRTTVAQMKIEPSWLETQAETLFDRLIEVALVLGAVTVAFLAVFAYLFVPASLEQYMLLETYFPWTVVALGALWYFWAAPRQLRPVLGYLRRAARGQEVREELLATVSATQRLPSRLAQLKFGFFATGGALLLVEAVVVFHFTGLQGALVFCAVLIVTLGTAIYELIWSRTVLRPVVAHLLAQPGADQPPLQAPSLRRKLLLSFGGVLVFTVVLPLFWSLLQYGNLRADFAAAQARRELQTLLDAANRDPARAPAIVVRHPAPSGSRYLFVPAVGPVDPLLPAHAAVTVRRRAEGSIELREHGLSGAYRRLDATRPQHGSLVVVLPLVGSARSSLNVSGLIFFFGVILAVALGVVLLTSADLTRPLATLEQRAGEMAQGKLDQRLLPPGEFDEIGRLTATFEVMRRALQAKIRTIEKLNISLEAKVQERTAALERSNAELVAAFAALQQTQQQLVTSEKMASVGQLVAGIAHEINNPVNAVINTVEPLAELVAQLGARHADLEGRVELEAMLRVIRSGAQRTQRIVQALRNYARRDGEALTRVDLHAEIEETLALLQHALRGVDVQRELAAPAELGAYRGELGQALMNLLANAAGVLEGREGARIVVRTRAEGERVAIEVEDNGPGIAPEIQPRIFDPFFTTKEVGKGTGLGLSITHHIVEHHGGKIAVRSQPGCTVFRIELPRR